MKRNPLVGFTGTQQGLWLPQYQALQTLLTELEPGQFHHGDCIGADEQAHYFVLIWLRQCRIEIHPPQKEAKRAWCYLPPKQIGLKPEDRFYLHLPRPYLERNKHIVGMSELLIAAPKSYQEELRSGTWSTVRYARKIGRPVYIVWPNGKVSKPK